MKRVAIPAEVFAAIEEWPCFFDADQYADDQEPWPNDKPCPWCGGNAPEWTGCRTVAVARMEAAE